MTGGWGTSSAVLAAGAVARAQRVCCIRSAPRAPLLRGAAFSGTRSCIGAVSRFSKSLVCSFHSVHWIILLILLKSSLRYTGIILMSTIKEPETKTFFQSLSSLISVDFSGLKCYVLGKTELNSCLWCNCLFRQASYTFIYSLNKKESYLERWSFSRVKIT